VTKLSGYRIREILAKLTIYAILTAGLLVSLFPFYFMFVSATNPSGAVTSLPPKLTLGSHLMENYTSLNRDINVWRVMFNSLIIAVSYTVLTIVLCSMAGYGFAKYEFRGKNIMFAFVLGTLMVPMQVLLVPLFNIMVSFGWVNTYQAVIVPPLANVFGVFLMRQNFLGFPSSLIEAARIDGYGEFSIFFRIAMPIVKPALGALTIYMFMYQWNNFLWPLIALRTRDMYTFPLALSILKDMHVVDYGEMMFGTTIATVPIMVVFLLFQKRFVSGLLGGAIKS
jgi:lactose/L-arabinose transport system permease protein